MLRTCHDDRRSDARPISHAELPKLRRSLPDQLTNGRRFICEFCQTATLPAFEPENIIDLGTEADLSCPACSACLTEALLDGQKATWCLRCRGILFHDEMFASTVRSRRARYGAYGEPPRPLNTESLKRRLDCCRCHRPMQVHPFYGPGNVVIDSCYPCRLIWLDAGEITQIEQAPGRR